MPYKSRDVAYNIEDLEIDRGVVARVRELRRIRGISQSKLASGLGVTFQQVQKYEKGSNRLSASMMVRTAAVLDVTVSELVGETRRETAGANELIAMLAKPDAAELLVLYFGLPNEQRNAVRSLILTLAGGSQYTSRGSRQVLA